MGISDEDYAEAIQKQIKQIKENASTNTTGSQNTIIGNGVTGITLTAGSNTTWASNVAVQQPYGTFKVLTERDLHHEAMKAPLSALIDMWTVRWADEWVDEKEFQEDNFWRIAMIRLTGANKLEKHNLANQYQSVYRIIE
jgi:hypothetical protein